MTESIVIVSGARTPIGSYAGSLSTVPTYQLGSTAVEAALDRAGILATEVDELIMGCIGQVGPEAYNARRVALAAGLPQTSTAYNVNRLCGSGLQAILSGATQLQVGRGTVVVAGGNENMSAMPYLAPQEREGIRLGNRVLIDGTLAMVTDPWGDYPMGVTAENVARRFDISRSEQDAWALRSQQRAASATAQGFFATEITPVEVRDKKGRVTTVETDEHPRPATTMEILGQLGPAFEPAGTVTAGNSSGINDAGAAVVLMREGDAKERGIAPLGRLVDWTAVGVAPEIMGYAPVFAVRNLLTQQRMTPQDIDVVELNEAFAAQVLAVIRDAELIPERVNPHGGAIALGHPVGATGAILTVKLLNHLIRDNKERGILTMCIGGGQALAALFERA